MNFWVISEAALKLGLPLAVISWYMFSWLHRQGTIDISGDSKAVEANLKDVRDARKNAKKTGKEGHKASLLDRLRNSYQKLLNNTQQASEGTERGAGTAERPETFAHANKDRVFNRWMWFGSGFYGLAALWTLFVVEVRELLNFVINFPGFEALFANGIVPLIVGFIVNQITNLFGAFAWMVYWDQNHVPIWMLAAYLGYMAGMKLAQFQSR